MRAESNHDEAEPNGERALSLRLGKLLGAGERRVCRLAGVEELGEAGPGRPRDGRQAVTFGAAAVLSGCDEAAGAT